MDKFIKNIKSQLFPIAGLLAILALAYSCAATVNDDPDEGVLSRQFLMGDVRVSLSPDLSGATISEDATKASAKTRRLKGGAVITPTGTASGASVGRRLAFYDPASVATNSSGTIILSSTNTNELLLIVPNDGWFLDLATNDFDGKSDMAIMKMLQSSASAQYYTNHIAPILAGDTNFEGFIPALAHDLFENSFYYAYEDRSALEGAEAESTDSGNADEAPDSGNDGEFEYYQPSFLKEGDALKVREGAFYFSETTFEKVDVDDGGKLAFLIVQDIAKKPGKFTCEYAESSTEDSTDTITLYNTLECTMDANYQKKLDDLQKLNSNFFEAQLDEYKAYLDDMNANGGTALNDGAGSPPDEQEVFTFEDMKEFYELFNRSLPAASFWAVGVDVGELVEKKLNRIQVGEKVKHYTTPQHFVGIITSKNADGSFALANSDFALSISDLREYIGELSHDRILARIAESDEDFASWLQEEEEIVYSEDIEYLEDDIEYEIYNPSEEEVGMPDELKNFENYDAVGIILTHPAMMELIIQIGDDSFCTTVGSSEDKKQAVVTRLDALKSTKEVALLGESNDEVYEYLQMEITDISILIEEVKKIDTIGEDIVALCDNTDMKDFLTEAPPVPPEMQFYSYEYFTLGEQSLRETMAGDLE